MAFGIYDRVTLLSWYPQYFKRLHCYTAGTAHAVIGKLYPDQAKECSRVVVRRTHRTYHLVTARQGQSWARKKPGKVTLRKHYSPHDISYAIVEFMWDGSDYAELRAYATRREAVTELRQMHHTPRVDWRAGEK